MGEERREVGKIGEVGRWTRRRKEGKEEREGKGGKEGERREGAKEGGSEGGREVYLVPVPAGKVRRELFHHFPALTVDFGQTIGSNHKVPSTLLKYNS